MLKIVCQNDIGFRSLHNYKYCNTTGSQHTQTLTKYKLIVKLDWLR